VTLTTRSPNIIAIALLCAMAFAATIARAADPLPSWNNGKAKQSIIDFVTKVTKDGSPDFVPVAERIATFDNDGTLWCEHPLPVQMFFAIDRGRERGHPSFLGTRKGDEKVDIRHFCRAALPADGGRNRLGSRSGRASDPQST
jgi:hypothetical protein